VAASMDNRRQPGNPELKQQEQQERWRQSPRLNRQKQTARQEIRRPPSPLPEPSQQQARLRFQKRRLQEQSSPNQHPSGGAVRDAAGTPLAKRDALTSAEEIVTARPRIRSVRVAQMAAAPMPRKSRPMPIRQLISQKIGPPSANSTAAHLRPLRSGSELSQRQPTLRAVRAVDVPQDFNVGRTRLRRPKVEASGLETIKPQSDSVKSRQPHRTRVATTTPAASTPAGTKTVKRDYSERSTRGDRISGPGLPSGQSKKNRKLRPAQKRPMGPLVYIIRLLILGIGLGALAGTLLSALNPATQASIKVKETEKTQVQENSSPTSMAASPTLGQEILPLKSQIQTLVAQNPTLQPGVFVVDLDTGAYLDWNSNTTFASASTIKLPILVAFFQDVDAGKIQLDEPLTLQPEMIATGSGDLQYKPPGTQLSALEVASKMIQISDNSATNMLIARLGGKEVLNQRFRSWGLTTTTLNNALPDIEGTNVSTPKELANLIAIVNRGELVSLRSRDRMLDIMQKTQINNLLPQGLGAGATIAHKTGNIGSILADVGLVDMPTGKRYIIAVMVKRPFNDISAQELIRKVSRTTYDYFNQPQASPSTTSMPIENPVAINRATASESLTNERPF
jgi:beta-lactamase class A